MTWKYIDCRDTGNGALVHRADGAGKDAGLVCYNFGSYCGREPDREWYEVDGDDQGQQFATAAHARDCASIIRRRVAAGKGGAK